MYSHVVVGADDLAKAKEFYDAIFAHLTVDEHGYDPLSRPFYRQGTQRFIITKPINGADATYANGGTIGFTLTSVEAVYAWHESGIKHGGTSAETPPHIRPDGKCIAYLRDPTGNKLCAVFQTQL
ncbi:VOC family protein [Neokomagataea thailandica]|uniref:Bleomycin resistance protein n=1 Tax=Neokomagataea tanensis NBRC 106556 TaxID=1223519 RepID=A0ABQ0QJ51_9PROT|nr:MULTISPECIES: VOC family protein [Neokomagataea]GBR46655.1 bleomycin resistance protein [Neokomagataea tanensis NBRC 106556]